MAKIEGSSPTPDPQASELDYQALSEGPSAGSGQGSLPPVLEGMTYRREPKDRMDEWVAARMGVEAETEAWIGGLSPARLERFMTWAADQAAEWRFDNPLLDAQKRAESLALQDGAIQEARRIAAGCRTLQEYGQGEIDAQETMMIVRPDSEKLRQLSDMVFKQAGRAPSESFDPANPVHPGRDVDQAIARGLLILADRYQCLDPTVDL